VVVGDPARARAVLTGRPVAIAGEALEVEIADSSIDGPEVIATLVRAGVGIREVRPIERSLEEIYLDAVGSD
jgi:hypothetical protein